ncbi:MAG: hypothetical protein KatS3mg062_0212 [Tepidiforma sp.]|nr:MAG: hypothetical protein KatS3mg062_0212 [Tepidiforma sp.]
MPLTRRRQTLAAFLAAVVAVVGLAGTSQSADADSDHPIVQRALRDLDTHQGECWPWVRRVVLDATGREMGFDYRQGFFDAGAVEVDPREAAPGDIIQVALDTWTAPDADYPGLHTAIVLRNNGDGTFDAIDSNQLWDGVVRLRPAYDPFAQAAANGLQVHIYRFESAEGTPSNAPESGSLAKPLAPGTIVRVNTPGDCLRLRTAPGGEIVQCLAHGTKVSIIEGPVTHLGIAWYRVETPVGDGWMAASYLVAETEPGAAPSAQGPTRPLRQYRAVVPLAAAD